MRVIENLKNIKVPYDRLAEVLLAGNEEYENGQDHDRVAVVVAID